MTYNRQSKALSTSLVKWKLTWKLTWKLILENHKQTNKQTKTKITYLETSEFNTKKEILKPLSTGDREQNEVIMTNRN